MKKNTFNEVNGWVVAFLVAAFVGVMVLAFAMYPTLGASTAMPLACTVAGIFLTAIGLYYKNENVVSWIALISILIAAYGYMDGLQQQNKNAQSGDWQSQASEWKAKSRENEAYAQRWEAEAKKALALVERCTTPTAQAN